MLLLVSAGVPRLRLSAHRTLTEMNLWAACASVDTEATTGAHQAPPLKSQVGACTFMHKTEQDVFAANNSVKGRF